MRQARHRKRSTASSHFPVGSRTSNLEKQGVECWLPGAGGGGNGVILAKVSVRKDECIVET